MTLPRSPAMITVLREIAEKLWIMQREPEEPSPSDDEAIEWYREHERYKTEPSKVYPR